MTDGGLCSLPEINVACAGLDIAGPAAAQQMVGGITGLFTTGLEKLSETMLTFWTDVGLPADGTPSSLTDPNGPVAFLRDATSWLTAFVMVVSIIIAGAKMVITQRHEAGQQAVRGLVQFAILTGLGLSTVSVLGVAGDQFTTWILNRATDDEFASRLNGLTSMDALAPLGAIVVLLIAVFGILASLVQIFLMIMRMGVLVVLAGILPLTAATAVTKGGQESVSKITAWMIVLVLYKPGAGIIYAAAFAIVNKSTDLDSELSGLFLMIMSVLALPALLRLIMPATSAMLGAATGGSAGAATVAMGGALATGALQVRSVSGAGGSTTTGGPAGHHAGDGHTPSGAPAPAGASSPGDDPAHSAPSTPAATGAGSGAASGEAGTNSAGSATVANGTKAASGAAALGGPIGLGVAAGVNVAQAGVNAAKSAATTAVGDGPSGASEPR